MVPGLTASRSATFRSDSFDSTARLCTCLSRGVRDARAAGESVGKGSGFGRGAGAGMVRRGLASPSPGTRASAVAEQSTQAPIHV